jgi:hypothetical protein
MQRAAFFRPSAPIYTVNHLYTLDKGRCVDDQTAKPPLPRLLLSLDSHIPLHPAPYVSLNRSHLDQVNATIRASLKMLRAQQTEISKMMLRCACRTPAGSDIVCGHLRVYALQVKTHMFATPATSHTNPEVTRTARSSSAGLQTCVGSTSGAPSLAHEQKGRGCRCEEWRRKPREMTRFQAQPCSSLRTPPSRSPPHPPKADRKHRRLCSQLECHHAESLSKALSVSATQDHPW